MNEEKDHLAERKRLEKNIIDKGVINILEDSEVIPLRKEKRFQTERN